MEDVKRADGNLAEEFLGIDGIGEFPEWQASEQAIPGAMDVLMRDPRAVENLFSEFRAARAQLVRRMTALLERLNEAGIDQENFDKDFRELMTIVQVHTQKEEAAGGLMKWARVLRDSMAA